LRSIQDLLERHLETRSLELLMKRGEGMSRQVEQLEGQLRQALAQRDSYEEQQRQLDNRNASLQMQIERGVMDADAAQLESFREQVSREMQRLSGELRRLNTEIVELESRLATKRGDLQEWQDFIDRRLGGL
jgi:chromosome segregation ATPase